jgi:hypothetical protein
MSSESIRIVRYPYLSKHTYVWKCSCGADGHHEPLRRLAQADAWRHVNVHQAAATHCYVVSSR